MCACERQSANRMEIQTLKEWGAVMLDAAPALKTVFRPLTHFKPRASSLRTQTQVVSTRSIVQSSRSINRPITSNLSATFQISKLWSGPDTLRKLKETEFGFVVFILCRFPLSRTLQSEYGDEDRFWIFGICGDGMVIDSLDFEFETCILDLYGIRGWNQSMRKEDSLNFCMSINDLQLWTTGKSQERGTETGIWKTV